MSRKKFEDLKSFIHFADNNPLDTSDKFAKVRGMLDVMNKNLKQFGFLSYFLLYCWTNDTILWEE